MNMKKKHPNDFQNLVDIEENLEQQIFNSWFNNKITISNEIESFLTELIEHNEKL